MLSLKDAVVVYGIYGRLSPLLASHDANNLLVMDLEGSVVTDAPIGSLSCLVPALVLWIVGLYRRQLIYMCSGFSCTVHGFERCCPLTPGQ
jgi:hypothetical protein